MANEWKPDAPDVNSEFNQAEKTQEPEPEVKQEPVTKAKLEQLEAEREAPVLVEEYTPDGPVKKEVHADLHEKREAEIKHIEDRLGKMDGKAQEDFNKAQQEQEEDEGMSF